MALHAVPAPVASAASPAVVILYRARGPLAANHLATYCAYAEQHGFATHVLDSTLPHAELSEAVATIRSRAPIGLVVADYEADQTLAADFRARYRVPGIRPEIAARFRDKRLMHRTLRQQGPRHCVLPDRLDRIRSLNALNQFARRHRYQIVLKPHSASGTRGLYVVHSSDELRDIGKRIGDPGEYIAEQYIHSDEPQFHVDSIVHRGQILLAVPSQYTYALDDLANAALPGSISRLHARSVLDRNIRLANAEVIRHLGLADGITHCEFFVSGGKLVFGEIAARMGGGPIRPMLRHLTGIDLCEAALGLHLNSRFAERLEQQQRLHPSEIGILLHTSTAAGHIAEISTPDTLVGGAVIHAEVYRQPGEALRGPEHSSDAVAYSLITGADRAEVMLRMQHAQRRFVLRVV